MVDVLDLTSTKNAVKQWREDEVNECNNELNKIKRLEAELRKDSLKEGEKNENLSSRMKSNHAKSGCDELAKKLKIKQRGVFSFLRESIREEGVDIEDAEEEINDKSKSGIQRRIRK